MYTGKGINWNPGYTEFILFGAIFLQKNQKETFALSIPSTPSFTKSVSSSYAVLSPQPTPQPHTPSSLSIQYVFSWLLELFELPYLFIYFSPSGPTPPVSDLHKQKVPICLISPEPGTQAISIIADVE